MEQTIYDIVGHRMKLTHQKQVLPLSRAMIQAESSKHRIMFLKVLQVCLCWAICSHCVLVAVLSLPLVLVVFYSSLPFPSLSPPPSLPPSFSLSFLPSLPLSLPSPFLLLLPLPSPPPPLSLPLPLPLAGYQ